MIFHFGTSQLMCQNKLLGVVGGVLGRNTLLIFQKLFTGKSVFLINQFTFWNFSHVNTIKCIFAQIVSLYFTWVPSSIRAALNPNGPLVGTGSQVSKPSLEIWHIVLSKCNFGVSCRLLSKKSDFHLCHILGNIWPIVACCAGVVHGWGC